MARRIAGHDAAPGAPPEGAAAALPASVESAAPFDRSLLRARKPIKRRRIQLHRRNALGDVIIATSLLPAIRKKHPDAHLTFTTLYPDVIEGNPFVDAVVKADKPLDGFDETIVFTYELTPDEKFVDAYAHCAGVEVDDRTPQIYLTADELAHANAVLREAGIDLARPICGYHLAGGWPIKDWPLDYFADVTRKLEAIGMQVVVLGEKADPPVSFGTDLRGKTNLRSVAAVISKCAMMLAVDSGLMHVATALRVPVVSLFGCTDPEMILPEWALRDVLATDIVCRGCRHRQRPVPAIFAPVCPWESVRCMIGLTPQAAFDRLQAILDRTTKPKVSIVIPHYTKFEVTDACLQSIFRTGAAASFEVIVVDDCSPDQSPARLAHWVPRIRLMRNERNSGFAATCNAGLAAARGEHVVFLNSDTTVTPGWLDELVRVLDSDPAIGLVGPKLLYPGSDFIQHCGSVINENGVNEHIFRRMPGSFAAANRPRIYRALTGACLMGRREELLALGAFDVAFHMSTEDTDLCFRYSSKGRPIVYCPASLVYHHEGFTRGRWEGEHPQESQNRALLLQRWSAFMTSDMSDYCLLAAIEQGEGSSWLRLQDVPAALRSKYDTADGRNFGRYPVRCEIVTTRDPTPGYIRVGRSTNGRAVDVEHDIAQPLPFPDAIAREVVARHVIDTLDWKTLPGFLDDIHRMLLPGGRALLSTISLRFIMEHYASGRVAHTRGDAQGDLLQVYGRLSPGLWTNLELFGDTDGGARRLCLDPLDLQQLCRRIGFSSVSIENFRPQELPGEVQLIAVR